MPFSRHVIAAALLAAACTPTCVADPAPASVALCTSKQRVMFHCTFGTKSVSLCADMEGERIRALRYRYGAPRRMELSYEASAANGQTLAATVAPLAPRASVRQVWFTRRGSTYLLSQCVGSACPQSAGLAVLRGDRVLSNQRCLRSADDRAWFAPELAQFGSDAASSRSLTELIVLDEKDNGIERLYPLR